MARPRSTIIQCSGCGQTNKARSSVCSRCGTALDLPEPVQSFPARDPLDQNETTRQPALPYEEELTFSSLIAETDDATQRTVLPPLREEDIFAEEEALEGPATRVVPKPRRAREEPPRASSPSRSRRGPSPSSRPERPDAALRPSGRSFGEETRLDRPTAPKALGAKHPSPQEKRAVGRPTPPPSPIVPPPPLPTAPLAPRVAASPAAFEPSPPAPVAVAEAPSPPAPIAISAPAPPFDPTPAPPPPTRPVPQWESSPLDPEADLYSPSYKNVLLDQDSDAFAPTPSVVRMLKGMGRSPASRAGSFWRNPLYLSLIGLGGLLAVVLVWGISTTETPRPPTPLPRPPAVYETPVLPKKPDGSGPGSVEKVALGFNISPKSADILLWVNKEKYPPPPARGSIDVPKGAAVEITIAAPGYKPQQRSLVIKKTEIIDVKLAPLKKR